jgi:hypothetical protein
MAVLPEERKAAPERGLSLGQYSLASMMVKTLTVCFGSAGFAEQKAAKMVRARRSN